MTRSEDVEDATGREEPAHRLHPMTLVQRAVVALPALVLIALPVFRSGDSSALFNLVLSVLYAAVLVPWMVLYYVRFRYSITRREVIIHSGVLTRRRRNIPVDRIQTVEIEQNLLHRLSGTARVRIHTAGSKEAEGALDVVSLTEARRIRETVRAFQKTVVGDRHETEAPAGPSPLLTMGPGRVLLGGAYRFSLLYIAVIFTFLQYLEPDPELLAAWLRSGRLGRISAAAMESPWTAAGIGFVLAGVTGWLSGIAVYFNRYHRFTLTLGEEKLHRRHGFLSVREGTIPLRRVQALILRTNPLMRRFGWYALDVQTMGTDVREQGHSVAVPFGSIDEVRHVAGKIREGMPDSDGPSWPLDRPLEPVSRMTIRRALVRYTAGLVAAGIVVTLASDYSGLWVAIAWPGAAAAAVLRWRCMGYSLADRHLVVRRGVLGQHTWIIPVGRLQVLQIRSSFFQRRLGLGTVYVDSAGASPVRGADVIDLDLEDAARLAGQIYRQFSTVSPR